ncbi:MAG: hypothetical protein ABIQ58_06245, partial [Candidatus Limnocylindrales bacterium]
GTRRSPRPLRAGVRPRPSMFSPRDVVDALTIIDAPWPGAGIVWMLVDKGKARLLDGPPRGVTLSR